MTPRGLDEPIKRESTSIKIRPDIWKDAKIAAIRSDMELSELVERAIEAWIEKKDETQVKRK